MAQWYCNSNGQQMGPMDLTAVQRMAAGGQLRPTDLVWQEGMANWVPASTVNGLFTQAPAQPGPPSGDIPFSPVAPAAGANYHCVACGGLFTVDNVYDNGGGTFICKRCHTQRTSQSVPNYGGGSPYANQGYQQGSSTGLVVAGYICAGVSLLFCPPGFGIAGIVIGINLLNRGEKSNGTAILTLSIACMVIGMIIGVAVFSAHRHF